MGTMVFPGGITNFEVRKPLIVHLNEDGDITLNSGSASVVVNAVAGSDWAISEGVSTISISSSCIIS
jgi:hypothetical protein